MLFDSANIGIKKVADKAYTRPRRLPFHFYNFKLFHPIISLLFHSLCLYQDASSILAFFLIKYEYIRSALYANMSPYEGIPGTKRGGLLHIIYKENKFKVFYT